MLAFWDAPVISISVLTKQWPVLRTALTSFNCPDCIMHGQFTEIKIQAKIDARFQLLIEGRRVKELLLEGFPE